MVVERVAPVVDTAAERPARGGTWWHGLLAVAAVLAVTVATLASLTPPAPVPADAPPGEFSASRAEAHLARIAARPHPVGSAAQDENVGYLTRTFRALGLRVTVQDAVGARQTDDGVRAARVRNVVARLPGSEPTGTVYVLAHTDSVPAGPGGADNAANVAALLETARALTTSAAPRNDIVFVLTDAEEACLCGAAAFLAADPLRPTNRPAVVLNFEARGRSGPVVMFETAGPNAALVRAYAAAAPDPLATSFAADVYRILPADTDLTEFWDHGVPGLNHAFFDGSWAYHTPLDTAAGVARDSLQQAGATALAETRSLGAADLADLRGGGDVTYFPVLGTLVTYPGWLGLPLAVLALALTLLLAVRGVRHDGVRPRHVVTSAATALAAVAGTGGVTFLVWPLLTLVRPDYGRMVLGDPYAAGWLRGGVVVLALTVVLACHAFCRRRIGPLAARTGTLAALAVLGVVLAVLLPGGAYLLSLPVLFAAGAELAGARLREPARLAVRTTGVLPSVVLLVPPAQLLPPALGLAFVAPAAILVAVGGLLLLPLVDALGRPRWPVPGIALAVALACLVVGVTGDRPGGARPVPAHLAYALDADTGQAWWASAEPVPGEWTAKYVDGEPVDLADRFPVLGTASVGAARPAPLPAPELTVAADDTAGAVRTVRMTLTSRRDAAVIGLKLRQGTGTVLGLTVDGQQVRTSGPFSLTVFAPRGPVEVVLRLRATDRPEFRLTDETYGLTGLPGFSPRPAAVGVVPARSSDVVVVGRTVGL